MKILFFGTGRRCEKLLGENKVFLKNHEIVAFVDNNEKKWGKTFKGKNVISPGEIRNYKYNFIFVTTTIYYEEIFSQLTKEYEIDEALIKKENYLPILFEQSEKKKHYMRQKHLLHELSNERKEIIKNKKIVVCTAIFGGCDELRDPEYIDENMDYVCYTDDYSIKSDVWEVRYVPKKDLKYTDPRRNAKIYKVLPHQFFKEYDISVWIDGSATIRGDLREYILKYLTDSNVLFTVHPWRNCIYSETEFSIKNRSFDGSEELSKQIVYYEKSGVPKENGLISGGFIVRFHNEPDVVKAMENWYEEIERYSTQDQVSFGYVAWKNNLRYDVADEWVYENKYLYFKDHLVERDES